MTDKKTTARQRWRAPQLNKLSAKSARMPRLGFFAAERFFGDGNGGYLFS